MKILKVIAFVLIILIFLSVSCYAAAPSSWYLVKHGNKAPGFPQNENFVSSHGGICMDKKSYENKDKVLYLTFDAGYENGNVSKILDIMKEEGVTGAFFILSNIINKNPEVVKRMADEGHLVCNHTSDHSNVSADVDNMLNNLSALEEKYELCTGLKMEKLFRFPEGKYTEDAILKLESAGYKTVFWSMAYDDWDNSRQPSADAALKKLLDTTHEGAIVLLHPTSSTNVEILPSLIKEWKSRGYRIGSLLDICK